MSDVNSITLAAANTAPVIPLWLEFVRAISPVLAALIAAFVAWKLGSTQTKTAKRQAETAAEKLRLDLFDKRLMVYESVISFITSIATSGELNAQSEREYLVGILPAKWLFNDSVNHYLTVTLCELVNNLNIANVELQSANSQEEKEKIAQLRGKLFREVTNQFSVINSIFKPYLQFHLN